MGACLKGSEWVVSCINMPNSCLKLCRLPTIYSTRNCDVSSFSSSCGLQKLLVALLLALTSLYLSAQASLSRDPACKQNADECYLDSKSATHCRLDCPKTDFTVHKKANLNATCGTSVVPAAVPPHHHIGCASPGFPGGPAPVHGLPG
eukprot:scaffold4708_cov18-Tisochrysis_lutea.AAC.1